MKKQAKNTGETFLDVPLAAPLDKLLREVEQRFKANNRVKLREMDPDATKQEIDEAVENIWQSFRLTLISQYRS